MDQLTTYLRWPTPELPSGSVQALSAVLLCLRTSHGPASAFERQPLWWATPCLRAQPAQQLVMGLQRHQCQAPPPPPPLWLGQCQPH